MGCHPTHWPLPLPLVVNSTNSPPKPRLLPINYFGLPQNLRGNSINSIPFRMLCSSIIALPQFFVPQKEGAPLRVHLNALFCIFFSTVIAFWDGAVRTVHSIVVLFFANNPNVEFAFSLLSHTTCLQKGAHQHSIKTYFHGGRRQFYHFRHGWDVLLLRVPLAIPLPIYTVWRNCPLIPYSLFWIASPWIIWGHL